MKTDNKTITRPNSANKPTNYTNKPECTIFDTKHKIIKKKLEYIKNDDLQLLGKGCFSYFYKFNNEIGIKSPNSQEFFSLKNSDFNNIFITSLLEICGEKTIDAGKSENENKYFDLASDNLLNFAFKCINPNPSPNKVDRAEKLKSVNNINEETFNGLEDYQKSACLACMFAGMFKTYAIDQKFLDLSRFQTTEQFLSFASRWLCKIFLFQMFDRKPENMVVMENKVKTKKGEQETNLDFCEIDFDDIDGLPTAIFYNIKSHSEDEKKEYHDIRIKQLVWLKNKYKKLIQSYKGKGNSRLEDDFKQMIANYTMIPGKIEELIIKTASKAKYMGLTEDEVIEGINEKMKHWKEMLNDKDNGKVVNQIDGIKQAREQTLTALNQIRQKDVERIVNDVMMFHDFTYDNTHFKDDNDVVNKEHKKTNEDIASKAEKMILAEKSRISKMQHQASSISRFVSDGREIQTENITADNLISYFKLEKDRSRKFFWFFGQRNKRFNALCEELEKQGIDKPENLFINKENYMEDEKQIRDLFDEQQQGNNQHQAIINDRPQQNTRQIRQQIANRLNQVGCCSCG